MENSKPIVVQKNVNVGPSMGSIEAMEKFAHKIQEIAAANRVVEGKNVKRTRLDMRNKVIAPFTLDSGVRYVDVRHSEEARKEAAMLKKNANWFWKTQKFIRNPMHLALYTGQHYHGAHRIN